MSIQRLMNQPLVVQPQSTTKDVYGNAILGPSGAGIPELGYLEQSSSIEFLDDRQTTVSAWRAYLFPTSAVSVMAYITFQAQKFQVDGEPWHVYNPRTQAVDHIECVLKVVT